MSKTVLAAVLIRNSELKKQGASVVDTLRNIGKSDWVSGLNNARKNFRENKLIANSPSLAAREAVRPGDVLKPALKGAVMPAALTAAGTTYALSGDDKPESVVTPLPDAAAPVAPPVVPAVDKPLAEQYLGVSTGSNLGDAAAAVAAAGGIYGLYQLLKKKKSEDAGLQLAVG